MGCNCKKCGMKGKKGRGAAKSMSVGSERNGDRIMKGLIAKKKGK